jgi:hypothetical protein
MKRFKIRMLVLLGAFLVLVSFTLRVDQSWAQPQDGQNVNAPKVGHKAKAPRNELKEAMDGAAKQRKSEGLGKTTTTDDRKAAARRNAERKAQHQNNLQLKGGATQ